MSHYKTMENSGAMESEILEGRQGPNYDEGDDDDDDDSTDGGDVTEVKKL